VLILGQLDPEAKYGGLEKRNQFTAKLTLLVCLIRDQDSRLAVLCSMEVLITKVQFKRRHVLCNVAQS
jgi:hypothetical protein